MTTNEKMIAERARQVNAILQQDEKEESVKFEKIIKITGGGLCEAYCYGSVMPYSYSFFCAAMEYKIADALYHEPGHVLNRACQYEADQDLTKYLLGKIWLGITYAPEEDRELWRMMLVLFGSDKDVRDYAQERCIMYECNDAKRVSETDFWLFLAARIPAERLLRLFHMEKESTELDLFETEIMEYLIFCKRILTGEKLDITYPADYRASIMLLKNGTEDTSLGKRVFQFCLPDILEGFEQLEVAGLEGGGRFELMYLISDLIWILLMPRSEYKRDCRLEECGELGEEGILKAVYVLERYVWNAVDVLTDQNCLTFDFHTMNTLEELGAFLRKEGAYLLQGGEPEHVSSLLNGLKDVETEEFRDIRCSALNVQTRMVLQEIRNGAVKDWEQVFCLVKAAEQFGENEENTAMEHTLNLACAAVESTNPKAVSLLIPFLFRQQSCSAFRNRSLELVLSRKDERLEPLMFAVSSALHEKGSSWQIQHEMIERLILLGASAPESYTRMYAAYLLLQYLHWSAKYVFTKESMLPEELRKLYHKETCPQLRGFWKEACIMTGYDNTCGLHYFFRSPDAAWVQDCVEHMERSKTTVFF